jgi:hypothetical protein
MVGKTCYSIEACAEDKAPVETDLSAVTGGHTAGQRAKAFCPFAFSAQPEAEESEKLIFWPWSDLVVSHQAGTSCSSVSTRLVFPSSPALRFSLRR